MFKVGLLIFLAQTLIFCKNKLSLPVKTRFIILTLQSKFNKTEILELLNKTE